jgi:tripartite-type tricarboxylate transporter receptor subunit TctC
MANVTYRGVAGAMIDVAAGHIQMAVGTLGSVQPFSQAGTIRILAVAAKEHLRAAPDIPTMEESGLTDLEMSSWWGIMAPTGTSPATIQLLNSKLRQAFEAPDAIERLDQLGIVARSETVNTFANFIRSEASVWGAVAKDVGIWER